MYGFKIESLPSRVLAPGSTLREVHLDKVMVTFVEMEPGSVIPPHSHPQEQISICIRGKLKMRVGEETRILEPGQGIRVPSNLEHEAVALNEGALAYDCWSPIREDYLIDDVKTAPA